MHELFSRSVLARDGCFRVDFLHALRSGYLLECRRRDIVVGMSRLLSWAVCYCCRRLELVRVLELHFGFVCIDSGCDELHWMSSRSVCGSVFRFVRQLRSGHVPVDFGFWQLCIVCVGELQSCVRPVGVFHVLGGLLLSEHGACCCGVVPVGPVLGSRRERLLELRSRNLPGECGFIELFELSRRDVLKCGRCGDVWGLCELHSWDVFPFSLRFNIERVRRLCGGLILE